MTNVICRKTCGICLTIFLWIRSVRFDSCG